MRFGMYAVVATSLFFGMGSSARIIGDKEFLKDPRRLVKHNVELTKDFVAALQAVSNDFDPNQHCVQIVSDTTESYSNPKSDYVEISSSGPCPKWDRAVEKSKVIARMRTASYYGIHSIDEERLLGEFTDETSDGVNITKKFLHRLCFGAGHNENYEKKCDLVLRNNRICDVVPKGKSMRPECH